MNAAALALAVGVALTAACGGDDGGSGPCLLDAGIAADLGEVDTSDINVHLSPLGKNLFIEVILDEATAPDVLHLELYGGQGVFKGGEIRTGTFSLSGVESRYDSCGACLLLLVDRDPGSFRPSAYFIAESGTLVLDAVADRVTGHLDDVTLRHVTIDLTDPDGAGPAQPSLATAPASTCRTHLSRAAFDVPFVEDESDAGP